jgi:hypothetical protein
MEPNNNNNNINNNNNNNNNLFPTFDTDAVPVHFLQLECTLKIGECVVFDLDDISKFGRIINYGDDDDSVIINEYIVPQQATQFVERNNIKNIQLVQQTQIQHTINHNSIIELCWIITTSDVDIHSITIGTNYKNFYGVTHRIDTVTNDVSLIDYKHGFVSSSVSQDIFFDLNLLRDQITRKLNTRSTISTNRFSITSSCSSHTRRYLIRNLSSTPLLEFDIRRACPRTGAQLAQYNNPIKYLETILRLDSKLDLADVNDIFGGGCLVGIRRQFPRMLSSNTVIGNDTMLHCVLGTDERSGTDTRYRYDHPRGSIDLTFFSNKNIIIYKCRYTAKPYSTMTDNERIELKLEAPVRNVLVNELCCYGDNWYTIVSKHDDNTLDLRRTNGRSPNIYNVSLADVQLG